LLLFAVLLAGAGSEAADRSDMNNLEGTMQWHLARKISLARPTMQELKRLRTYFPSETHPYVRLACISSCIDSLAGLLPQQETPL
jgi:hypothetical protein